MVDVEENENDEDNEYIDVKPLCFLRHLFSIAKNNYLKYDSTYENDEKYSIPYPKYNDSLPILDVYIYNIQTGKTIRVPRPIES